MSRAAVTFSYIGLAIISLNGLPADATEWDKIIQTPTVQIYADINSYLEIDGKPSLTTKTVFTSAQALPNQPKKRYFSQIRNSMFNCQTHLIKNLTQSYYDKNHVLLLRTTGNAFQPTKQDVIDQKIESLTCQVQKMVGGAT